VIIHPETEQKNYVATKFTNPKMSQKSADPEMDSLFLSRISNNRNRFCFSKRKKYDEVCKFCRFCGKVVENRQS